MYADYKDVKINVLRLKSFIENFQVTKYLTHIDAVPDNFLIDTNNRVYLIDWEYAGNQDVHVDIAMFAIYSGYDKMKLINSLIFILKIVALMILDIKFMHIFRFVDCYGVIGVNININ